MGIQKVILPKQNAQEASIIDGIVILGAEVLNEVVNYLNEDIPVHVLFLNKDKHHVMQQVASHYSSMDDSFNSIMEDMFD